MFTNLKSVYLLPEQVNFLLTGSSLANIWNYGKPNYINLSMIGGTVGEISNNFKLRLHDWKGRCNVIVTAGLNNISTDQTTNQVMKEFENLICFVKELNPKNLISISEVPFAPKFTKFSHRAKDNMKKTEEINKGIILLNQKASQKNLKLCISIAGLIP